MPRSDISYAITDRRQYGTGWPEQRGGLVAQAKRLAADGVDYLQLREKDLPAQDLIGLAREILSAIRISGAGTKLLINARADVAIAAGADGVHLPAGEDQLTPTQVRRLYAAAGRSEPTVTVSCHTLPEVERARNPTEDDNRAHLILFGPVFEKVVDGRLALPGVGLDALRAACDLAGEIPVLALGGITAANRATTIAVGAAGIAAIRLFR
jgi:thiamine-phosphate pyrophosphorylase